MTELETVKRLKRRPRAAAMGADSESGWSPGKERAKKVSSVDKTEGFFDANIVQKYDKEVLREATKYNFVDNRAVVNVCM